MVTGFQTGVKATFLVTKKKGMSDEEFEQHYTEVHIPMVAGILNRHRVLYYGVVSESFEGSLLFINVPT